MCLIKIGSILRFTRQQHRDSSDEKDESPARNDEKNASSSKTPKVPTTSTDLSAQTTTKSIRRPPPPPSQPQMKVDIDLDINDTDLDLIIPDDDDGLQLIDAEELQEIVNDMPTGLFPTISSVTSLHPSIDRGDIFEAQAIEPSNIL